MSATRQPSRKNTETDNDYQAVLLVYIICICIYVYIYLYIYIYIYIKSVSGMGDSNRPVPLAPLYTYIYIYTYIHTSIHTYKYTNKEGGGVWASRSFGEGLHGSDVAHFPGHLSSVTAGIHGREALFLKDQKIRKRVYHMKSIIQDEISLRDLEPQKKLEFQLLIWTTGNKN